MQLMHSCIVFVVHCVVVGCAARPEPAAELARPAAGEWPTFMRDLGHSGAALDGRGAITKAKMCKKWERRVTSAETRGASGPLVASVGGVNVVFFVVDCPTHGTCEGDASGSVYALRGDTGAPMWEVALPRGVRSDPYAPTLADVDGDGRRELVFASNNSGNVLALRTEDEPDGKAGSTQWTFTLAEGMRSEGAPIVLDIDSRDPTPEIVLGTDADPAGARPSADVVVLRGKDGTSAGKGFSAPSRNSLDKRCQGGNKLDSSSPSAAWIDGGWKIYVGGWNGNVYALEWKDSTTPGLVATWTHALPASAEACPIRKVRSGITVAQLVPGGAPELAFGHMAESDKDDQYATGRLRVLSAQGLILVADLDVSGVWKSTPVAADFDPAAPGLELAGGKWRGLYSATAQKSAPRWDLARGNGNGGWGGNRSTPAVADIDGDGDLDLVIGVEGEQSPGLVALDGGTGEVLWEMPMPGTSGVDSSPALGNLDADGDLEVVFLGRDGLAYAIDSVCAR